MIQGTACLPVRPRSRRLDRNASVRALLRPMRAAPADLLVARALMRRTETKFLFSRADLAPLLRSLTDGFDLVHSRDELFGTYRNLYFDTPDLRFFHDHRRGVRPRSKVRIRQYVERELGYFEIKTKDKYDVTSKQRRPQHFMDFAASAESASFIGDALGLQVQPAMQIDFRRVTLLCRDVNERITFDLDLTFGWGGRQVALPGVVVGEIKQERFRPRSPGMRALLARKIRPMRMSKYCVAMSLLRDGLPTHRFRPPIRQLMRHDHA